MPASSSQVVNSGSYRGQSDRAGLIIRHEEEEEDRRERQERCDANQQGANFPLSDSSSIVVDDMKILFPLLFPSHILRLTCRYGDSSSS